MKILTITAENLSYSLAAKVRRALVRKGVEVLEMVSGTGDSEILFTIKAGIDPKEVRKVVWNINGGAYCEVV